MGDESLIEKPVHSSKIYEGGLFNLRKDRVRLPNGRTTDRHVIEHPGAVAIVAVIDDRIVLVRQFRQAAGKILCELPAGTLRKGEAPDSCAARELREETGYSAGDLNRLFHCYLAPGYSTEIIHIYLATNLRQVEHKTDSDEFLEVLKVTKIEALKMVMSNEIEDAKTMCGILMLQRLSEKSLLKDS